MQLDDVQADQTCISYFCLTSQTSTILPFVVNTWVHNGHGTSLRVFALCLFTPRCQTHLTPQLCSAHSGGVSPPPPPPHSFSFQKVHREECSAYRERRSCSVLKPAKDWLRMIPLGPPGEWVPDAMISGTRDDTPGRREEESTTGRVNGRGLLKALVLALSRLHTHTHTQK